MPKKRQDGFTTIPESNPVHVTGRAVFSGPIFWNDDPPPPPPRKKPAAPPADSALLNQLARNAARNHATAKILQLPAPVAKPVASAPPVVRAPKAAPKAKSPQAPPQAPPQRLDDYAITKKSKQCGPTAVVQFSDGILTRMTFATADGKALNTGRGLRLCVGAYRAALYNRHRPHFPIGYGEFERFRAFEAWIQGAAVPEIYAAHIEDHDGGLVRLIAAADANRHTAPVRRGAYVLTAESRLELILDTFEAWDQVHKKGLDPLKTGADGEV